MAGAAECVGTALSGPRKQVQNREKIKMYTWWVGCVSPSGLFFLIDSFLLVLPKKLGHSLTFAEDWVSSNLLFPGLLTLLLTSHSSGML